MVKLQILLALTTAVLATQVHSECCADSDPEKSTKFCALFATLHDDDKQLVMQYLGEKCDKDAKDLLKELEKRKPNFLRFGRSYDVEDDEVYSLEDKKAEKPAFLRFGRSVDTPNFLRFGKNSEPKFLRFGKRKPNFLRFGKRKPNFLRFGRGAPDEEEEQLDEVQLEEEDGFDRELRKPNFLRFGKRKPNFLRFGKRKPNFLRFGKRDAPEESN